MKTKRFFEIDAMDRDIDCTPLVRRMSSSSLSPPRRYSLDGLSKTQIEQRDRKIQNILKSTPESPPSSPSLPSLQPSDDQDKLPEMVGKFLIHEYHRLSRENKKLQHKLAHHPSTPFFEDAFPFLLGLYDEIGGSREVMQEQLQDYDSVFENINDADPAEVCNAMTSVLLVLRDCVRENASN